MRSATVDCIADWFVAFMLSRITQLSFRWFALCGGTCCALVLLSACTSVVRPTVPQMSIVISVADQQLAVLNGAKVSYLYPISTAKAGVGEANDSDQTPRGKHKISIKIGGDAPLGMVFVERVPTGEIVTSHIPGRWPVTTRILRLDGLEERNKNTFERLIYIHGSPVEHLLGKPASGGCIRMRATDVVELFDIVSVGTPVHIFEESMSIALTQVIAHENSTGVRRPIVSDESRALAQVLK